MDTIATAIEKYQRSAPIRSSTLPFVHLLYDLDHEDVYIGSLFELLRIAVLRLRWPQFIYATAITNGIVDKLIVVNFFGREFVAGR